MPHLQSPLERSAPAPAPAPTARWRAVAEVVRVPNLFTASANVVAGYAVATGGALGAGGAGALALGAVASASLYAGGVALNDWFDRDEDARERPERPIPSGRLASRTVAALGFGLLGGGVALAALAGPLAGAVAAALAVGILAYDVALKHTAPSAALTMGTLRGLNLLLGASLAGAAGLAVAWPLALLPFAHVGALTLVARHEVAGGGRGLAAGALAAGAAVAVALGALAWRAGGTAGLAGALFAGAFALLVVRGWGPVARGAASPAAVRVGVVSAVLAVTLLDAALASAFAGPAWGAAVALLLVPATLLSKTIQVT